MGRAKRNKGRLQDYAQPTASFLPRGSSSIVDRPVDPSCGPSIIAVVLRDSIFDGPRGTWNARNERSADCSRSRPSDRPHSLRIREDGRGEAATRESRRTRIVDDDRKGRTRVDDETSQDTGTESGSEGRNECQRKGMKRTTYEEYSLKSQDQVGSCEWNTCTVSHLSEKFIVSEIS
ncbi:uncharacterized protein LOC126928691 isoform X2 [Bombus affinis]|uniref:uncharacterized protein LOC126928691 isoform X2 n=1 Tax=Bombus affinis TaxID=309941 RepID=UPI0021B7C0DF|nr:uncharacterized protein LOC126928691 isoform X2 [Bombus affinis]